METTPPIMDDCGAKYKKELEARKKLLDETDDALLGKMYRQRKEANDFLAARGLY